MEKKESYSHDELRQICIAFREFNITETHRLIKLKEEGKTNLGYISFNEWFDTIYNIDSEDVTGIFKSKQRTS